MSDDRRCRTGGHEYMRAIIIGAGRGRRLMPTTADAPKCFAEIGGELLREHYHRRRREFWGQPYRGSAQFQKAYLIHLFQDMIEQGVEFGHADTHGQYREIDTQEDLDLAQKGWAP